MNNELGTSRGKVKAMPWFWEINGYQWKTLAVAVVGFMFDAMDLLIYSFVISNIMKEFSITPGFAGTISTIATISAVLGGYAFGVLADFIGRSKTLFLTVIIYSVATLMMGFSQSAIQLVIWRFFLGLGLGGEWGAGMALVTETWPAKHRMKAIAFVQAGYPLGFFLATIMSAVLVPYIGWRGLFMVGAIPAIFVAILRLRMPEPKSWSEAKKSESFKPVQLFQKEYIWKTIILTIFITGGIWGYNAGSTWLPSFLAGSVEKGGAASPKLIVPLMICMTVAQFIGYMIYGYIGDRTKNNKLINRIIFVCGLMCAIGVLLFSNGGTNIAQIAVGMIFIGLFQVFFASYGVLISESFPTRIRGTALGFVYNTGRLIGGQSPLIVGLLIPTMGLGKAMAISALGFILVSIFALMLPKRNLEEMAKPLEAN